MTRRLKRLIPALNLPDQAIAVVHRSDGSGTTYIFTNYLSKVSDVWNSTIGNATSVNWPGDIGGQGNAGVAGAGPADTRRYRLRGAGLCRAEQTSMGFTQECRRKL